MPAVCAAVALHAATIHGSVVENLTGKPLSRVRMTLQPLSGTAGGTLKAVTNTFGAFEFPPVAGGAYLLTASRANFATTQYGAKGWNAAGLPIVLEENSSTFLNLRLPRLAAINGRVVDENDVGLPAHDVAVYRNTRPPQLVRKVKVDERGVYRVYGLDPGSYLVRTVAHQYPEGGYLPTFATQTFDVEQARAVEVALDQEATDIDVRPAQGQLVTIAGKVLPARPGLPVRVTLVSETGRETIETTGDFHFQPAAPGQFEIFTEGEGTGTWNCDLLSSYQQLQVDRDQAELRVPAPCMGETPVRVVEKTGQRIDYRQYRLIMRRKDLAGAGEIATEQLSNTDDPLLAAGRWDVMLLPPAGYCVTGFSGPGAKVNVARPDGWNEIVAGSPGALRYEVSSTPGSIHGAVTGTAREAVFGAPVFLEPWDRDTRTRTGTLRVAYTDARGAYRFDSLAPGRYRILASFEFRSPDSAAFDAAAAGEIEIQEGRDTPQDLDLFVR